MWGIVLKPLVLAFCFAFARGASNAQPAAWQPSPGHAQAPIWPRSGQYYDRGLDREVDPKAPLALTGAEPAIRRVRIARRVGSARAATVELSRSAMGGVRGV